MNFPNSKVCLIGEWSINLHNKNPVVNVYSFFTGNYTFNITASNDINSVNTSQSVALYVDIRNLKFVKEPELHHGEVNKTYTVSFMLEAGERPTFHVDFGNNVSLFFSCDDDNLVNKTITKKIT